jgi:hypothetical protein
VGKPEGKRQLETPCRWEDNITMDLREIEWDGMDWINLAEDRALVNTVMNLQIPGNVGKFLSSCATGGFSRRAQLHGLSSEIWVNTENQYEIYWGWTK